jgi:formylglycine-generating enzyme required for sulfatase activity
MTRPLRVFLCHSSADKSAVRELYNQLTKEGIDVWLDEKKLLPGQLWKVEIPKAVRDADAVIVCLSKKSVTKEGYVQKEIAFALDIALEKPEGTIYLIPAKLEECKVPEKLRDWHWVDLSKQQGIDLILKSLQTRADSIDLEIESHTIKKESQKTKNNQTGELVDLEKSKTHTSNEVGISINENKILFSNGWEFMRVPAGKFIMGSNINDDEKPEHTLDIPYAYWTARYPVTNEQYNAYAETQGLEHPVLNWQTRKDHPVIQVKWSTALEFCKWLNNLLRAELPAKMIVRLPTEAEWEKAARGTNGLEYPWGRTFESNRCNSYEDGKRSTTPIGLYSPLGDSPYGCADMIGNVREWTHSEYKIYPYTIKDGREDSQDTVQRVCRGGSYFDEKWWARCAFRYSNYSSSDNYTGFRVVIAPPLSQLSDINTNES